MTDLPPLQGGGFFPYIATDLLPLRGKGAPPVVQNEIHPSEAQPSLILSHSLSIIIISTIIFISGPDIFYRINLSQRRTLPH